MKVSIHALFNTLVSDLRGVVKPSFLAFVADGNPIPPDASRVEYAAGSLLASFMKKFVDETEPSADARALDQFLTVNKRCANWELVLGSTKMEELVGLFKKQVDMFLHPKGVPLVHSYYDLLREGRCGPGASLGVNGNDFYTKLFSSKLSSTSLELYDLYADYISWYPSWVEAEASRILHHGTVDVVSSSKLCFVPKTREVSRTICVEPSLNMFYQLGLAEILGRRLTSRFGIDLGDQANRNRRLAWCGSVSGLWATIDLSSASDSMSWQMLSAMFPAWFFDMLWTLRTPIVSTPRGPVVLSMISTMGNGYTFPLETMVFSCAVAACQEFRSCTRDWGVFGDDIACSSDIAGDVISLLKTLGFEVNAAKSFVEGPFRESCGADFFDGSQVRGVYVKTLKTQQDRYAVINLLTDWCERSGINLPATLALLRSSVKRIFVPLHEDQSSGIRVPLELMTSGLCTDIDTQSLAYLCYVPRPRVLSVLDDRIRTPNGEAERDYNPSGLLLSFCNGSVVSGSIGVRHDVVRYSTRRRITPFWDYVESPFRPEMGAAAGVGLKRAEILRIFC